MRARTHRRTQHESCPEDKTLFCLGLTFGTAEGRSRRASDIEENQLEIYVRMGLKMLLGSEEVESNQRNFPRMNEDKPDSGYPPYIGCADSRSAILAGSTGKGGVASMRFCNWS